MGSGIRWRGKRAREAGEAGEAELCRQYQAVSLSRATIRVKARKIPRVGSGMTISSSLASLASPLR
jgi:hypothetical protein